MDIEITKGFPSSASMLKAGDVFAVNSDYAYPYYVVTTPGGTNVVVDMVRASVHPLMNFENKLLHRLSIVHKATLKIEV